MVWSGKRDSIYIPFCQILRRKVDCVSGIISAVSEDKGELDFGAVRGYHKMRRK